MPSLTTELERLEREFPHLLWAAYDHPPADALVLRECTWRAADVDLYAWDRCVLGSCAAPGWVVLCGDPATLGESARQILTRYQRLIPRTNDASRSEVFRAVLARHHALHDLDKPLVRADYDHALDVWQWVLRLAPGASAAVQLAALFHDIERLASEADERVEHKAADYQAFKDAHASAGARMTAQVLEECGVDRATTLQVARLIEEHERPHGATRAGDLHLLGDADALSFFSLNSPGFADYYGPAHLQKKIRYSLGRMSAPAVERLAGVRLRADVAAELAAALDGREALLQGQRSA